MEMYFLSDPILCRFTFSSRFRLDRRNDLQNNITFYSFAYRLLFTFHRCEADPEALARYVLALLKKDKTQKDLHQCMNQQLDVFLNAETKPFLERLFNVIATEEYLNVAKDSKMLTCESSSSITSSVPELIASSQETHSSVTDTSAATESESITSPHVRTKSSERRKFATENPAAVAIASTTDDSDSPLVASISKLRDVSPISPVKSGAIDSDHNSRRDSRRRSARSRSRSRSRTRRNLEREKYNNRHSYRNKSPPSGDDRRKTNPFRRNSGHEIRSPKYYKRSHSPMDGLLADERKGTRSLSPSVKNDRCRDFDEKGYCMRGETCPWDHGVNPVVLEDINNPMMAIQTTQNVRSGGEYNPDAPEIWSQGGYANGPNRGVAAPAPPIGGVPPNAYPRLPANAPNAAGFRGPNFPFPVGNAAGPPATTPLQRELISVPVVEANLGGDISASQKRRYEPEDTVAVAEGATKRKVPINSRLGPPNRVALQNNCSLELRKVPRGLNSIAHLNNHFCKFGKIVNIQVSYEGDPEAAIVTFSTHAEANVAYRSTEAVLNNRFIKVFWHTPGNGANNANATDGNHNAMAGKDETNGTVHPRKPGHNQYVVNNTISANTTPAAADGAKAPTSTIAPSTPTNTTYSKNTNSVTQIPPASAMSTSRVRNNRINRAGTEALRKKKEEQVKAAVQFAHGLHKRKHELLQGYLKQMRSCVDLVEKIDSSDPQRATLLTTIKTLQGNIDKLKEDISKDQAQITAQIQPAQVTTAAAAAIAPFRKSKELQKKELLDIELELIAQQQEGNDTTAIQKRIEELQKSLGAVTKPTFASTRPIRGRIAPPGSTSFDRRPTTLLIAGFAADECDAVLGHFKVNFVSKMAYNNVSNLENLQYFIFCPQHYGEITKNEIEKSTPFLKITYATRLNAEQAMLRGRRFKEKQLQVRIESPKSRAELKSNFL